MKSMNKSIGALSFVLLSLLILSIYVVVTQPEDRNEFTYYEEPYIRFQSNLEFPFDKNNEIQPDAYLDQIVDRGTSIYDEILSIDFRVDKVGKNRGTIKAKRDDVIATRQFVYTVIDDEAPILYLDKPIILKVGEALKLENYVRVSDNSLGEDDIIKPKVIGNVDINRAGYYTVTIEATDASGNKGSFVTVITVGNPIATQQPTRPTNPQGNNGNDSQPTTPVPVTPEPEQPTNNESEDSHSNED